MEITQFDIKILVASTFVVLAMSFTFPPLGLAPDDVSYQDMPELDVQPDRFDVTDGFPRTPGTPVQGYLYWTEQLAGDSENQVWVEGGSQSGGVTVGTLHQDSNNTAQVVMTQWNQSAAVQQQSIYLNGTGDQKLIKNFAGYDMLFELEEYEQVSGGADYTVRYDIRDQPSSDSWYNRIPYIGSAIPSTEQIAGILSWIGSIIYWIVGTIYESITNTAGVVFDVASFVIEWIAWIFNSYTGIVTSGDTPPWVDAFTAIPGMLMLAEWLKLVIVLLNTIWIG